MSHPFDPDRLQELIDRAETLDRDIERLQGDKSALFHDAAALGFNVAALKVLLKERRRRRKTLRLIQAEEEMVAIYRNHIHRNHQRDDEVA
jgi:uncharacterized protein (UPF0335 family)